MKSKAIVFLLALSLLIPLASTKAASASNLNGKILLQVESKGEAWYVNPKDGKRYYMANGDQAFQIMKTLGVGMSNKDVDKLKTDANFRKKFIGKILLQVESKGEAYYISSDGRYNYLKDGASAYQVMRKLGLGVSNKNLEKISRSAETTLNNGQSKEVVINKDNTTLTTCTSLINCVKYKDVEISGDIPSDAFYLVKGTSGKQIGIKPSEELIGVIKKSLDKYPSNVLKRYLNRIYLMKNIYVNNLETRGVADPFNRRIFITINNDGVIMEQAIHHELSHVLSSNPDNSYWLASSAKKEIAAINPENFQYGSNNILNKTDDINSFSQSLAKNGFLTGYSTVNIEEDIAQMAMNMFKNNNTSLGTDFWGLIDNNSKLKEKFNLLVKFYQERDAKFFNENYFRVISKQ